MSSTRRIATCIVILVVWAIPAVGAAKTLSREEVAALWEQLLLEERYEAIQFSESSGPTLYKFKDKRLHVQEMRGGRLFGLFGLSTGGGWDVEGQLEAEASTDRGILQLYSKASSEWAPGFAFVWMPGYDPEKYPIWEFRLILRNPVQRREIRTLKSVSFSPTDVLPTLNPDGSVVKELLGQRVPRGELDYDAARNVAIVRVLGLRKPITLEVPVSTSAVPAKSD